MPYRVERRASCPPDRPFAVVLEASGETVACHSSAQSAQNQIQAIYASEHQDLEKEQPTSSGVHVDTIMTVAPRKKRKLMKFAPALVAKGDYVGHPFRGNQWTDSSGNAKATNSTLTGFNSSNPWNSMFGGHFDVLRQRYDVDERAINKFIADQHTEIELTEAEKMSVGHWQSWDYDEINAVLRENTSLDSLDRDARAQVDTTVAHLNAIFNRATLTQDAVVFRGVNDDEHLFDNISEGDIVTDKGIIATSLNPVVASLAAFGGIEGRDASVNPVVFRIKVPKGSPAIAADKLSNNVREINDTSIAPNQNLLNDEGFTHAAEIILPPNSRFRVNGESVISGMRVVDLEVIPSD